MPRNAAVKIATFNINHVGNRLPNLLQWLDEAAPDVVCLQELKALHETFPAARLEAAGYGAVWRGEHRWNGVAILARGTTPVLTRDLLPGDPTDLQSRYIEAAIAGILVASIYLPNGNPQPGPKFTYKLAWFDRLRQHARDLASAAVPVVLAGDYNVAPTDLDIYPNNSWVGDALVHERSRECFAELVSDGWTDAFRQLHPDERAYSYWDYRRQRWHRNAGLRLDHLLLSPDLKSRLAACGIDREVRDRPDASDHAPVWIELASAKVRRGGRR